MVCDMHTRCREGHKGGGRLVSDFLRLSVESPSQFRIWYPPPPRVPTGPKRAGWNLVFECVFPPGRWARVVQVGGPIEFVRRPHTKKTATTRPLRPSHPHGCRPRRLLPFRSPAPAGPGTQGFPEDQMLLNLSFYYFY